MKIVPFYIILSFNLYPLSFYTTFKAKIWFSHYYPTDTVKYSQIFTSSGIFEPILFEKKFYLQPVNQKIYQPLFNNHVSKWNKFNFG